MICDAEKKLQGGGTHLDCATLPGENGRLAFVAEEIVFTISKLRAEYFSVPFQDLKGFLSIIILVIGRDRGRTLMAREVPGSSSNLYSVSGSSTLVLELPELLVDIETRYHADKEGRYFVMNFGYYDPGDASNGATQRWSDQTRTAAPGTARVFRTQFKIQHGPATSIG